MTYEQIAETCFVSTDTVRSTLVNARQRLGANTTAQAAVIAIAREELGLTHEGLVYVPIEPGAADAAQKDHEPPGG